MNRRRVAVFVSLLVCLFAIHVGLADQPAIDPLLRTVDLNIGQQAEVRLCDGSTAAVKLVALEECRDTLRNAVREARATIEVNGERATLVAAYYRLPVTVGGVQIDCAATKGITTPEQNPWALDADARFRLWPAGSPWIRPGTFVYPAKQKWFASDTQMANDPVYIDGGEIPSNKTIYYHWGLDIGGSEAQVEVVAAADGVVLSLGNKVDVSVEESSPVRPRYDVIYLRDDRGWYHRYSHLHTIEPSLKLGQRVSMGQKIGLLGKEGGSGGWSHLHFDLSAMQPSGRYGIVEGYAFLWQVYHQSHNSPIEAVARPHQLAWTGDAVTLDGSRSWCRRGPEHIRSYEWTFCDGTTATRPKAERSYARAGMYTEILKVTDDEGHVDYDFAVVQVIAREHPDLVPPSIHPVYWPTEDLTPGEEITFKVRSFRLEPDEGNETWDFGDGTPPVTVRSDGNAVKLAKDGYAVTTHRYEKPGDYLVRVERTNSRGETAINRLHVRVEPRAE
ncbi:MAG: peptidoglycan DD-metalloendopeptidase family protein [Pirellulales bacterium]|nr:peptidoglycan DD-metalloendopeptidase family protein [Pirellulales bacterium]